MFAAASLLLEQRGWKCSKPEQQSPTKIKTTFSLPISLPFFPAASTFMDQIPEKTLVLKCPGRVQCLPGLLSPSWSPALVHAANLQVSLLHPHYILSSYPALPCHMARSCPYRAAVAALELPLPVCTRGARLTLDFSQLIKHRQQGPTSHVSPPARGGINCTELANMRQWLPASSASWRRKKKCIWLKNSVGLKQTQSMHKFPSRRDFYFLEEKYLEDQACIAMMHGDEQSA